ncbi:MAG: TRAP transporter large permease, partial [Clostridiales bacterium]|nr:TRAP transporter large permease [Clostridiales bacterium]
MVGLVLIGVFVLMLILNVPVGISLGIASLVTVLANPSIGASDTYIVQNLVTAIDSFPLMAVPFFVLAGELMSGGGISKRLLNTFNCFFGRITGGLAIVAVVACMFFAAISGSGPATVAAIGGMVLPTMIEKGYDRKFILGLLAAAGCIGVIIPPSIPMVIYGVSTNASITDLFLAGFIPGIVIGLALIAVAYFISKKHGWRDQDLHMTGKEKLKIIWEAKWALIAPVIVLGGIYGGIFTPTEAAAVSCIYSFVVGMFVCREASLRDIGSI